MRDLLIITPSRGRPEFVSRLVQAVARTTTRQTDICFGFDNDDPQLVANKKAALAQSWLGEDRVGIMVADRMQLGPWTNLIAMASVNSYTALASFGDDHEPLTYGWDTALLDILATKPGFVCPNGIRREEYPEAVVVSSKIVKALGWFCEPSLEHYCVDQVWLELAKGADCWTYRPDIVVAHGPFPDDDTRRSSETHMNPDSWACETWRAERKAADIETVRKAVAQ